MNIDANAAAKRSEYLQPVQRGVLAGLAALTLLLAPAARTSHDASADTASTTHDVSSFPTATIAPATGSTMAAVQSARSFADFGTHVPSPMVRGLADWIADSRNNSGSEFIILDKRQARLYVFDVDARLRESSPVLLGAARGDDTVPGIGSRAIADVQPHERTTPAGRFVAERGRNSHGEDVVWVDYDAAVSIHRVRATDPRERRLQRLASETIDDNRISYGCINVPVAFYEAYVRPIVATRRAIVYVLPESRLPQEVFGSYDVAARVQ